MLDFEKREGQLRIAFRGTLSTLVCMNFENEVMELVRNADCPVVFDLSEVSNVSSMFLRICAKALKNTGRDCFSVDNANDSVMKIFKLTRFNNFLNINC